MPMAICTPKRSLSSSITSKRTEQAFWKSFHEVFAGSAKYTGSYA